MYADKKYWAFLSYSHQDTRLCEWLHRELETFRVPTRLVGRETREGVTPNRLFPVFRDRDELPGSSELGKNLAQALEQSRYLVVICSPAAARSRWVNEEIRQFKAMGGEHRVLALIIDGEPNAAEKPESGLLECFPEALKYRVSADGQLSTERVEPIAADIRKGRESRSTAVLRLIAGLLGVPFDELRQRDQERRRRALTWRIAVGMVLAAGFAGVSHWKYREARMERLEELGREAMMQSRPSQAAVYLAEAYRMGNDKRSLRIMLDQAMRSVDMLSTVHFDDSAGFAKAGFSDDGTRLLASNQAGAVSIWRADNGQTLLQLKADSQSARVARFLPGGREIALLYQDGRIEVLDARTGKRVRTDRAPAGFVPVLEDGHSHLALYQRLGAHPDQAGSTLVYDLLKQNPVRPTLQGCAAPLSQIAANGKNFFCVGATGSKAGLQIVPLEVDGPARRALAGMDVRQFVASRDGLLGVAGTGDGVLTAMDLQTQKPVLSVRDPAGGVPALALSGDGQLLAVGGETGNVLVWSVRSGALVAVMAGHTGRIKSVHFLGDSPRLATLGDDGFLKIWNTANATLISAAEPAQGYLVRAALTADGERMATFAESRGDLAGEHIDPALKVWDLLSAGPMDAFGNGKPVHDSAIASGATRVVFEGESSSTIWDLRGGRPLIETPQHLQGAKSLSRDGQRMATALGVTDLATGKLAFAFNGHTQSPRAVWSLDGKVVASASDDATRVWDVEGGSLRSQLATDGAGAGAGLSALSPNGQRLLMAHAGGATLFDTTTGQAVAALKEPWGVVSAVEASRNGKLFRVRTERAMFEIDATTAAIVRRHDNVSRFGDISACKDRVRLDSRADNSLLVSSLTNDIAPLLLFGQAGLLSTIDCDADMQLLLTGGANGDAMLWSASTAKPILRFTGHSKNIGGIAFLPEPGQFATSGADGTFQRWSFAEEKRRPLTISRRLACRIPLALEGYTLKPSRIDASACQHERVW